MMTKTFIDVPAYADNPAEYERVLSHNASILTKPQLIKLAVGLAIESEQNRMGIQEAGIDAHEDALTIKYLDKFKLRQKGQHLIGGDTTKAKKEAHKAVVKGALRAEIESDPKKEKWTDSHMADHLIRTGKADNIKKRTLQTYLAEIRAEQIA